MFSWKRTNLNPIAPSIQAVNQSTWRKLPLGVDEATDEILAAVATTNDFHDGWSIVMHSNV
jgi:hypothetical protein